MLFAESIVLILKINLEDVSNLAVSFSSLCFSILQPVFGVSRFFSSFLKLLEENGGTRYYKCVRLMNYTRAKSDKI